MKLTSLTVKIFGSSPVSLLPQLFELFGSTDMESRYSQALQRGALEVLGESLAVLLLPATSLESLEFT